ncbi:WD repeat, SAM and U-box domain-containing protein 1 [Lingula anatina]|uniref:WD repeat, SAM and U-box domain-containing protein 1 n=1 Tax=Lingula anatina TaxID=7574 RepID=A0A1S3IM37_LINAN|nr:WD repeat, SAM and U-box domain-containing protein 1 [Lingula anatina]|eukprot:XP_013399148.1 WD repeat, SAM and U-box domain-containing protein 1 [Lingula anatina]
MTTVANLIHTISLHQSDVNWVAYSGKTLATCSGDKTVRLWSTEDFTEYPCSPLCGHGYYVHCCVFSPFGTMLASCSTDGKVILWDSKTGEKKGTFEHPSKSGIRVCRFSPNSSWLVTGSDDETLVIWDMKTKKLHRTLVGHTAYVNAVAYTPCSGFLVSGSSNGDLRAWDAEFGHGPCLWYELEGHDLGVMCCEFSPTFGAGSALSSTGEVQYLLATCGNDNLVKLWNFRARFGTTDVSLILRDTLAGHRETVMAVCFSSSGNMIASGSVN